MGVSTVITSGKGGVGKSTVCAGLGLALGSMGRRVLMVDCDAGLRCLDRLTGADKEVVFDISDVVHGRCAPKEAIYPCPWCDGLFVLPASPSDLVTPAVMRNLGRMLKKYFDHVLFDSPAGLGVGFAAAACSATRALVVASADPMSIRAAQSANALLKEMKIEQTRLIINRLSIEFFREMGTYEDLDAVIDSAGIRLIGVVPEDLPMSVAMLGGCAPKSEGPGMLAFKRIALRLEGERVPMYFS